MFMVFELNAVLKQFTALDFIGHRQLELQQPSPLAGLRNHGANAPPRPLCLRYDVASVEGLPQARSQE